MMGGSVVFLLVGFVAGCVVLAAVWAVVSTNQHRTASNAEEQRNSVVAAVGALCAEVDNAVNSYRLGSIDAASLKEAVRPKLEQINAKLKTNMKNMDAYFMKYVEKFVTDQLDVLLGTTGIAPTASHAKMAAGVGEVVVSSDSDEEGEKPQFDLFDESDKRTTALPAIGTADAAAAMGAAARDEDSFGKPKPFVTPPSFERRFDRMEAAAEPAMAPASEAGEEQWLSLPQEPEEISSEIDVTQVMETATPSPVEQEPLTAEEPEAGASSFQEEEIPLSNTFIPIEESGLLESDVAVAEPDSVSPFGVRQDTPPEIPVPEIPSAPGSSDTQSVSADSLSAGEDMEQTQVYDREALSEAMASLDEQGEGGIGLGEAPAEMTPEDASASESFLFGGQPTGGSAQADAPPPLEETPPVDAEMPPLAAAYDQAASQAGQQGRQEEVFEVALPEEQDDDELITGEDVVRKLDNFFGFDS